mgnify:CR=1
MMTSEPIADGWYGIDHRAAVSSHVCQMGVMQPYSGGHMTVVQCPDYYTGGTAQNVHKFDDSWTLCRRFLCTKRLHFLHDLYRCTVPPLHCMRTDDNSAHTR